MWPVVHLALDLGVALHVAPTSNTYMHIKLQTVETTPALTTSHLVGVQHDDIPQPRGPWIGVRAITKHTLDKQVLSSGCFTRHSEAVSM